MDLKKKLDLLMKEAIEKRAIAINASFEADKAEQEVIKLQNEIYNYIFKNKGEQNGESTNIEE